MTCLITDHDRQTMAAQDEDALVGGTRRPGGFGWQIGKQAVDVRTKASRVAGAGMRRRQRVIGPALRQQPLTVP